MQPYSTFSGSQESMSAGAAPLRGTGAFLPGKRRRLNMLGICINALVPWCVFCGIYAALSFSLHYQRPLAAWATVLLGLGLTGGAAYMSYRSKLRERDPMWHSFSAIALLVATIAATVAGDLNYWYNLQPFYDIGNLNTYPSVNPAREKGQQLMDAGRIYFAEGTSLDLSKSMGFKNLETYCVAPIVHGEEPLASYDFWAVGVDCCSGVSADFRCGEYNNPHARSGLRLMRDDQRPFFRLAVQQAEAAYNIKSAHPLFFYWMQDPVAESASYRDNGMKYYLLGIATHFAVNLFAVACAVVAFSKIGHY